MYGFIWMRCPIVEVQSAIMFAGIDKARCRLGKWVFRRYFGTFIAIRGTVISILSLRCGAQTVTSIALSREGQRIISRLSLDGEAILEICCV